ncbi:MAG: hypothetical protein V1772_05940 [Chloroflexota bacterium]
MGTQPNQRPPTDYRRLRRQGERRNLLVAVTVLVVGGAALIGLFFGLGRGLAALPWLLLGAGGIVALYALVAALEHWANRDE